MEKKCKEELYLGERPRSHVQHWKKRYVIVHRVGERQHAIIDCVSLEYLEGYLAAVISGKWHEMDVFPEIPTRDRGQLKLGKAIEPLKKGTLLRLGKETSLFFWYPDFANRVAH